MAASVLYTNFGGMLCHEDRGGVQRTYVHDEMGSTSYLVDATSVTDTYTYSPYGQVSHTGSNVTPFTFIGALGYFATGWSMLTRYVRARWYSNVSGQWWSVDPNWPIEPAYGYVRGRVTSWVDASGEIPGGLGLLKECGYGILGSISSIVHNGSASLRDIICGIGQGCISALIGTILGSVLGVAWGPIGECFGGMIGALVGAMVSYICIKIDPCLEPINTVCFAMQTFMSALSGCLSQVLGGVGLQWIDVIMANFLGFAGAKLGQSCDQNGIHYGGTTFLAGSQ